MLMLKRDELSTIGYGTMHVETHKHYLNNFAYNITLSCDKLENVSHILYVFFGVYESLVVV